ncbi:hypothetical protein AALA58_09200 [Lactococcus ileimucosae]
MLKHKTAIQRGIVSPYSHGPPEGSTTFGSSLSALPFGFGRFDHLRKQILLQQILVKHN